MAITLTLELPDDLAQQLATSGRDLSRAALEAFAVEEYRAHRLTDAQFRRLLGLSRWEADGLLQAHQVWLDYTIDDFRRESDAVRADGQRPPE